VLVDWFAVAQHAFQYRHGAARYREIPQVERHGKQRSAKRVDDVPGRKVAGIGAAVEEPASLARFQRLRNDLRLVPAIGIDTFREREEERLSVRQDLGTVRHLALIHRDEPLRLSTGRGNAQHALAALAKDEALWSPAHPVGVVGRADR